jgi:DNA repair protein RecO (recombination protein O)
MSRTYQTTGIILKGMPLGEADRLLTILSPEFGLIRAVAPGARKNKSKLRGRCELFMVNHFLISKGRSLDKITQIDLIQSYPGLTKDLGKLAGSQYLAEVVLCLALSEQPQNELYEVLNEHLRRLEQMSNNQSLHGHLAHGVFHLLAIAGLVPEVQRCCLTQETIVPNFTDAKWRVGFSFEAGGLINLSMRESIAQTVKLSIIAPSTSTLPLINHQLGSLELSLLQQLNLSSLSQFEEGAVAYEESVAWVRVEHLLREYSQYHLGRSFRAATLVDTLSELEF